MKRSKIMFDLETEGFPTFGGLKAGELSVIMAPIHTNKSNFIRDFQQRMIEKAKADGYVIMTYEMGLGEGMIERLNNIQKKL